MEEAALKPEGGTRSYGAEGTAHYDPYNVGAVSQTWVF